MFHINHHFPMLFPWFPMVYQRVPSRLCHLRWRLSLTAIERWTMSGSDDSDRGTSASFTLQRSQLYSAQGGPYTYIHVCIHIYIYNVTMIYIYIQIIHIYITQIIYVANVIYIYIYIHTYIHKYSIYIIIHAYLYTIYNIENMNNACNIM